MKHRIKYSKKFFSVSALLLVSMHVVNRYIDSCVTPVGTSNNSKTFQWKDLTIVYNEKGDTSAPPLLLLHNLYPSSSKEEWYRIDPLLDKQFHIYELDLPGCGQSDKPNMIYINYMYVQIISDFIKNIIKKKCNICATSFSNSFTFMAARINPDLIDKIISINPPAVDELVRPVSKINELKKRFIELPIIGTFLYNCKMSKAALTDDFKYIYFYNDKNVPDQAINLSYYNAHTKHNSGKYLYGSITGNYTNINIIHALSKIDHDIYLIANGNYKNVIKDYKKYNKNIHTIYISNCRLLPQLEIPKTIAEKINSIFYN